MYTTQWSTLEIRDIMSVQLADFALFEMWGKKQMS